MHNFAIIPDSSCDMTTEMRKRFGVDGVIRGVIYKPDGTQMLADTDYTTISPEAFFDSMKGRNMLYKTATPPTSEIIEVFEPILKSGRDILSISLSSGLSSTINMVQTVAGELLEKYPDRKIICVDSLRYASAIMLMTVMACKKRDEGASLEETADYVNDLKMRIHQMGPLDDLFFCAKTGRISNFKAFFGTLVGISSFGDFNNKGITSVLGKVKGKPLALETTVQYIEETIVNPEEQIVFIGHSNRLESAEKLASILQERLHPKEIIINPIGMSCGCSIGPGLCAAYYIGHPVSEDCKKEKEIMDSVIKSLNTKKQGGTNQ